MRITGNEGRLERENFLFKFQMAIFHRGDVPFVRLRCIARVMLFPSPAAAAAAAAVDLWPR